MRVFYINNDGGGFADEVEIPDNMSVEGFFRQRVKGRPEDYLIRVNRQPAAAGQVLQPGDKLSVTPVKIEGAA